MLTSFSIVQEKAATELRKLRQSLCCRGRPVPDFYKEIETPKDQIKNVEVSLSALADITILSASQHVHLQMIHRKSISSIFIQNQTFYQGCIWIKDPGKEREKEIENLKDLAAHKR